MHQAQLPNNFACRSLTLSTVGNSIVARAKICMPQEIRIMSYDDALRISCEGKMGIIAGA